MISPRALHLIYPLDELGAPLPLEEKNRLLQKWIQERGHECVGPPREVYLVGPGQVSDPAAFRTEVQWPIR
jgi:effector-binding domain-containing protein